MISTLWWALQNQALVCPLGTRETGITKIINKYNYCAEKKSPNQQKSLASPLGIAPFEPFKQLEASFMTSHALLVHIKLSHIQTN